MKNRWVVLGAGVLIQTILGGIYAWSVFVPGLVEGHGLSQAQTGAVFGVSIAVFTVAMIPGGRVLARKGPRFTAVIGALLFMAGYRTASLSGGSYPLLLLGIGVLGGAGTGFGYVCPLTVGMQWFPDRKGLITGIAVAGFGGGATVLAALAARHLGRGTDVLGFFAWMALVPGSLLLLAALLLSAPPRSGHAAARDPGPSAVFSLPFLVCASALFLGTFSGLLVIGNLAPIALSGGLPAGLVARGVAVFAAGNASGRVLWGYVFDRIRHRAMPVSLGGFAAALLLLMVSDRAGAFLLASGLLGFGFGANFVIYASALSRHFGLAAFPRLYPICFLGYGLAGLVGPGIGGHLADLTGSYDRALVLGIGLALAAMALTAAASNVFEQGASRSWEAAVPAE